MSNDATNPTVAKRQIKEKSAVINILRESPVIHYACKKIGISRSTYYRWQQEDEDFGQQSTAAFDEGIEYINDMTESRLISMISEGKMPAVTLWLKNNHPRYKPRDLRAQITQHQEQTKRWREEEERQNEPEMRKRAREIAVKYEAELRELYKNSHRPPSQ